MADQNENKTDSTTPQPSTPTGKGSRSDRRTLRGLFIKPRQQLKYSFMFMGGGMMILCLFIAVVIYSVNRTLFALESAYGMDPSVAQTIRQALTSTLSISCVLSAVLAAFSFVIGLQLTHRIYGPLIPLQRHIDELRNGNFSSRVHLRKNDEMLELQEGLNSLATALESKYGSSGNKRPDN